MSAFTVNQKTQSGNRIIAQFAGSQFGLLQSVRMNDDYAPEAASGIGDIHAQEYVPTMARHTISVQKMLLSIDKMRASGVLAENGDAVLLGLVFDIVVQDKATGTALRTYSGCSFASGDVDITKHSISMTSGQFNCLDVRGTGV